MKEDTFSTLSEIHNEAGAEDKTVVSGKKHLFTRFQLMVSTENTDNSAASLLNATRNLLSAMKNKIPSIKFLKWNEQSDTPKGVETIPKSIEKAEEYIYNFSCFSKSQKGYYRVFIRHDESSPQETILAQSSIFNIKQKQYISLADSQAL